MPIQVTPTYDPVSPFVRAGVEPTQRGGQPVSPHAAPNPEAMPTPAPVAESGTGGLYGQEEGTE
jgi:hypothetical protein